jgi:hypothetical protein
LDTVNVVVELMSNVSGQIITIPVETNVRENRRCFFPIDPAPLRYRVAQLQASLTAARARHQTACCFAGILDAISGALTILTHARYSQSPALQHRTRESLG